MKWYLFVIIILFSLFLGMLVYAVIIEEPDSESLNDYFRYGLGEGCYRGCSFFDVNNSDCAIHCYWNTLDELDEYFKFSEMKRR